LLNNLVKRFNAKSNKHLLIIFIIFSLSGSGSLFISAPIISAINLEILITYYPLYLLVRILIIIPIYQIILIIIATLFGEFNYFWKFEKKILQRLKLIK
jgi:manganese efflux pump family protein